MILSLSSVFSYHHDMLSAVKYILVESFLTGSKFQIIKCLKTFLRNCETLTHLLIWCDMTERKLYLSVRWTTPIQSLLTNEFILLFHIFTWTSDEGRMMSRHGLKRSRSLWIDVQRHWACCVVRSTPTWIRSTLHRARRCTKKLFSFNVSSARRHRRYLDPRRCCWRRRCCRHRAQVVLVLVRVVLDRGVAFPLLLLSSRRVSRRCRRSSELDGVVV